MNRPPRHHPLNIPVTGDNPNDGTLALGPALALTPPSGGFGQANATQFGVHPALANVRNMFNSGDSASSQRGHACATHQPHAIRRRSPHCSRAAAALFPQRPARCSGKAACRTALSDWMGWRRLMCDGSQCQSGRHRLDEYSISGQNSFEVGGSVIQYAVSTSGIVGLSGYNSGTNTYGNAANYGGGTPTYSVNDAGRTLKALDVITKLTRMQLAILPAITSIIWKEGYNDVMKRARDNEAIVGTALGIDSQAIADAFDTAVRLGRRHHHAAHAAGRGQPDEDGGASHQGRNDLGTPADLLREHDRLRHPPDQPNRSEHLAWTTGQNAQGLEGCAASG